MELAERLQDLRRQAGYSQEQVAELLEISRQAVSKWESGQGKPELDNFQTRPNHEQHMPLNAHRKKVCQRGKKQV